MPMETMGYDAAPQAPASRRARRAVPWLFGAIVVGFFSPGLFHDEVPVFRDFLLAFIPFKLYAAEAIRAGRFPLWIREYSFGAPFFAAYLNGVLYPPAALVYLFPGPFGIAVYLAVNFWIAGFGMFRWLLRRGLGSSASAFGALAYMLGGLTISFAPWNHLSVLSWLPWTLAAAEDAAVRPRPIAVLRLILLLLMQVLGGAPESFAQSALLVAGTALVCGRGPRAIATVGAAGLLALGLGAVQLVPTVEYFAQTQRLQGLDTAQALSSSLDPRTLWTLLAPHRLDGGIVAPVVEGKVPLLWSLYVGVLPIGFAVIGAATRRGIGWALVAAASLALALGEHSPVYLFLYEQAPRLLSAFRFPQKFLFTWYFAVCALAACGFHAVLAGGGRTRRALAAALLLLTLADLWDVHFPAQVFTPWSALRAAVPSALATQGFGTRIYHYRPAEPGLERWVPRYWQGHDVRARSIEFWGELAPDVPILYGIDFVNGNDSMSLYREGDRALVDRMRKLPVPQGLHLLGALGIRLLLGETAIEDAAVEALAHDGPARLRIERLRETAPRVYLARRVQAFPTAADALDAMAAASFVPGEDATVVGSPVPALDASPHATLSVVEDGAERVVVDVMADGAAFLVVGDAWFPGWRATIDGREAPILRANGFLRGVSLPGGDHRVEMIYAPRSLAVGLAISAASAVLVGAWMMLLARRLRAAVI